MIGRVEIVFPNRGLVPRRSYRRTENIQAVFGCVDLGNGVGKESFRSDRAGGVAECVESGDRRYGTIARGDWLGQLFPRHQILFVEKFAIDRQCAIAG